MPTSTTLSRADIARLLLFVQEWPIGSNKGRWVEALQRIGGTDPGQPWCMCFVTAVLDMAFGGKNPLPTTASCQTAHDFAKAHGWLSNTAHPGDVFLVLNSVGVPHHAGLVIDVNGPMTMIHEISGNTNSDGSREGYAVVERDRLVSPLLVFINLPAVTTITTQPGVAP